MQTPPDARADTPPDTSAEQGELFAMLKPDTRPSFAGGRRWRRRVDLGWWLLLPPLLLSLAALALLAERDRLAGDARWRPHVMQACQWLGCELAPWHEPTAIRILARDVRPHPSAPEALLITATFRNDATWAQPWPQLSLALQDLEGRTVARRVFRAEEYLGAPPAQPLILAGQSVNLTLEVLDPDRNAVAFTFDFR